MLDIKLLREDLAGAEARLRTRGGRHDLSAFRNLDRSKRNLQLDTEKLQARRNEISREIGLRKGTGEDCTSLFAEMKELAPKLKQLESKLAEMEVALEGAVLTIPNLPHASVPVGADERGNVEVRRVGTPPGFGFAPQAHWDLGPRLGVIDFEAGATLAGARFSVLRGAGARLSRGLINFMLDLHTTEFGYTEILPPFLANTETLTGTGQLPKFSEELFRAADDPYYLIPTAEVPLTNLVRGRILEEGELPLKFTAWTPCFRREAGAAGKDTRGLIRQHQFDKVELVQIVAPRDSYAALEELTSHAEEVLRRLELPYRVIELCTGDLGFSAAKTYDLEVWLPGQGCYREISSCSNTEAFQARRLQARYRPAEGKEKELVHTLNGSGLAVGRTLVAILENFQQADGSITIPDALRPHLGGMDRIPAISRDAPGGS